MGTLFSFLWKGSKGSRLADAIRLSLLCAGMAAKKNDSRQARIPQSGHVRVDKDSGSNLHFIESIYFFLPFFYFFSD